MTLGCDYLLYSNQFLLVTAAPLQDIPITERPGLFGGKKVMREERAFQKCRKSEIE